MKITHCELTEPGPVFFGRPIGGTHVEVTFEDGSTMDLFSYYPDEVSYRAEEFIGLAEDEARKLHYDRDMRYLRS